MPCALLALRQQRALTLLLFCASRAQAEDIAVAEDFMGKVYATRSVGKALPQVTNAEMEGKDELYKYQYEILRPIFDQMVQFMHFSQMAVGHVRKAVDHLAKRLKSKETFISDAIQLTLARLMSDLLMLDVIKNHKTSWTNDLSVYRRAGKITGRTQAAEDIKLESELTFFVATQNK